MATTVIKIDPKNPRDGYDIYMGRANPRLGLAASVFANPFRIGRDGSRADVVTKFRNKLMSSPQLLRLLPTLRGLTLGCYCGPNDGPCHARLCAELADNPPAVRLTDSLMDPNTQECFGWYLYGTGVFAQEGRNAARAATAVGGYAQGFCDRCQKRQECWTEHQRRVGETDPDGVKAFFARVAEYQDSHRGSKEAFGEVAKSLALEGTPDPWMAAALLNCRQGELDREANNPPGQAS